MSIEAVQKYLTDGAIVPVDKETTTLLVEALREVIEAPQREWVGLTYEDYEEKNHFGRDFVVGAEWAEAKLKEKNK